jgi:cellulose biosynthesis protein BcsQ
MESAMPIITSYGVWNNKGGVGKSTISFHLATRYAELNPDAKVLAIDLCPQANLSMMLLGGGIQGENRVLQQCVVSPFPATVVGYLASVLSQGPGAALPPWQNFVIQPHQFNNAVSDRLHLLCGDGNLEPMAPLISERAGQAPLGGVNPWTWVHLLVRRFIEDVATSDQWLVIVDTNPSFSIYTELAISSVERLVVPVNADDASRVAANALFTLIWGANPPHPIYGQYTFAARADNAHIARPAIHLIVGNRLTQHLGAARAFAAMSDATADTLFTAHQQHPIRFTPPNAPVGNTAEFRAAYSVPLRDFNTAGVVSAHLGTPLSGLRDQYYPVHGEQVRVESEQIRRCTEAIDDVVKRL